MTEGIDSLPPTGFGVSENDHTKFHLDLRYKADIGVLDEESVVLTISGKSAKGIDVGFDEQLIFDKTKFKKFLLEMLED